MDSRSELLSLLVGRVRALPRGRRLIASDGVDGSGKTVLASELADALHDSGRNAIEVHVDDFHHLRQRRYRRGRTSAERFWLDSDDDEALERDVLRAAQFEGSGLYRWGAVDLDRDVRLDIEAVQAPDDADHRKVRRYVDGQQLSFDTCRPWERASLVVDNRDWSAPRVIR